MNIKTTPIWKISRSAYYGGKIFFNTYIKSVFTNSFSQYGEDVIIDRLLCHKKRGFYIDIGANHPDRFSNTKRFYVKGWSGINIEPNPIIFKKFAKRTRDVNLNIGIGGGESTIGFLLF